MLKRSIFPLLACFSLSVGCDSSDGASDSPVVEGTPSEEPTDTEMGEDSPTPVTPSPVSPGTSPGPAATPGPGEPPAPVPPGSTPPVTPANPMGTDTPPVGTGEPPVDPVETSTDGEDTTVDPMEPEVPTAPTEDPEETSEMTSTDPEDPTSTDPVDPMTGDCRVWLATDGDDANDGTEGSPVATLAAAYELMCPTPPAGTANGAECLGPAPRTICVRPGTYAMTERLEFKKTRMGTADNRLILQGDPASTEKPLFDFSGQERLTCGANPDNIGGLTINAHYVTVKNLAVRGANDNCVKVQGTEGLVENVLVYECADAGIQIGSGGEFEGTGTNNTVLNCDSHSNHDIQCEGENADGFAVKEGTGTGNAFIGCRAWNNVDDGWDLFAWTSPVRIENCWAFDQCATTEDTNSDCNGFKLGGDEISAVHELVDLISVGNSRATGNGFTENSNPASMSCSGTCAAWGNSVDVDSIGGISTTPIDGANVTNMAADSARNADGSLKSISEL